MLEKIGQSLGQAGDSYLHRVALAAKIQAKIKSELAETVKVTFTGSTVRVYCQSQEQAFVLGIRLIKLKRLIHALTGRGVRVSVKASPN